jgi:hypothetical protein
MEFQEIKLSLGEGFQKRKNWGNTYFLIFYILQIILSSLNRSRLKRNNGKEIFEIINQKIRLSTYRMRNVDVKGQV